MSRPRKELETIQATYKRIMEWPNYFASSCGDIYSIKTNKFLKQRPTKRGYLEIKLSREGKTKTKLVHRLIAETFIGKSNETVEHKDFNKTNNNIENLIYLSSLENHRRAVENDRIKSGSSHYKALFTKEEVNKIRSIEATNYEIAKMFNTNANTIYKIRTMRTYKNG